MSIVSAIHLHKTYAARRGGAPTTALFDVSLEAAPDEFVSVMGPSGSGKTTLLNLLALIDRPDSGSILYGDEDVRGLRGEALARFRRRRIGFVFQDSNLIDTMTLGENISLPLALDRRPGAEISERVGELAARLGIGDLLGKYPCETSGGERQRASSARALACRPTLLLADEPTGALDTRSGRALMECFRALHDADGNAVLMVTHDPFAASWSDRVVFLRDGRLVSQMRRGAGERAQEAFFDRILETLASLEGGAP